jgi:hypothetical protein
MVVVVVVKKPVQARISNGSTATTTLAVADGGEKQDV